MDTQPTPDLVTDPDAPLASCGDSVIAGAETCDDGNDKNGDGCSKGCVVEQGFRCEGTPSRCAPICGDGLVLPGEACDDGDDEDGDGCSARCAVEDGYSCSGAPSSCAAGCGDGLKVGPEACDDGNDKDGDGCSKACAIEDGWSCSGAVKSSCVEICGDGKVVGGEGCDDGAELDGDGCDKSCQVAPGYSCSGAPSKCVTDCGDGVVAGDEQCDDKGKAPGDGCSPSCTVEAGWSCSGLPQSSCSEICGDGLVVGGEQCDEGSAGSDLCSTSCAWSCKGPGMAEQAGSCYWAEQAATKSWDEARLACAQLGPGFDLAAPSTQTELNFLVTLLGTVTGTWIGANDRAQEGSFVWSNGEPFSYTNGVAPWNSGEPNNSGGQEDCAEAHGVGHGLNDVACAALRLYACERLPFSAQSGYCRDGRLDPGEGCDDGNAKAGDGCDPFCQPEPGYQCAGNVCTTICGDGIVTGGEACDDGQATTPGCDGGYKVEAGYVCSGSPSVCQQVCGDGVVTAGEACDDKNLQNGDGCSDTCQLEHGFSCDAAQPSVCASSCGDGLVAADEGCDDNNGAGGDGCSAGCQIETGWSCSGEPSSCSDGYRLQWSGPARAILDDAYVGSLTSMRCIKLNGPSTTDTAKRATVSVGIDHNYVGDLTIKVESPTGKVITVLERPRGDNTNSNPSGDDGGGCCGDASNLVSTHPITFDDLAAADGEALGQGLSGSQAVCKDGGACSFKSNPDEAGKATPPSPGLAGLVGEPVQGLWRVCVADSEAFDFGTIGALTLHLML